MGSRRSYTYPAATASALANEAAARGLRPPLQLMTPTGMARGWQLLDGTPDALYADEYGELWWGRMLPNGSVQIIRPCWPEEQQSLAPAVDAASRAILSGLTRNA